METDQSRIQTQAGGATVLAGRRNYLMVAYNVTLAILSAVLLVNRVAFSPYLEPELAQSASAQSAQSTSIPTAQPTPVQSVQPTPAQPAQSESASNTESRLTPEILLAVMFTMAIAGVAGGTLCNLRGLFEYGYQRGGLPSELEEPYYIRPLTGAITGLSTFFVGYLITSALSDVANLSWATLSGRLPYIGLALLAGFASQEFTERMKAVAETLFSQSNLRQLSAEDQLRKLKKLKDEGLISDEEYILS